MAGDRDAVVARPRKNSEHEIRFATSSARKGWRDLVATLRNPMAATWDFLTATPQALTATNYPLKGELAVVARGGVAHQRWQHKPTLRGGARTWFSVHDHVVHLEQVHTAHPHQTK